MRKFVVSDLHGCGEVYDSIMGFLDNISLVDSVELTINGDLIDRGLDSFRMLMDVEKRIQDSDSFPIRYLAGNHELLMYSLLKKKKEGKPLGLSLDWKMNGGEVTRDGINSCLERDTVAKQLKGFIGDLKVYHAFEEKVGEKPILVSHASAPKHVVNPCIRKIEDNSIANYFLLWAREYDDYGCRHMLGHPDYFTILGHSVVEKYPGFLYKLDQNFLRIDGGCAAYASGEFRLSSVPLVEICDGYLKLFIFNHNNEIVDGYYFDGYKSKMSEEELKEARVFLNPHYNDCEEGCKKAILKAWSER